MAEMIGMPYTEVMIAAILPAVLYFMTAFCNRFRAGKDGLLGCRRRAAKS